MTHRELKGSVIQVLKNNGCYTMYLYFPQSPTPVQNRSGVSPSDDWVSHLSPMQKNITVYCR